MSYKATALQLCHLIVQYYKFNPSEAVKKDYFKNKFKNCTEKELDTALNILVNTSFLIRSEYGWSKTKIYIMNPFLAKKTNFEVVLVK